MNTGNAIPFTKEHLESVGRAIEEGAVRSQPCSNRYSSDQEVCSLCSKISTAQESASLESIQNQTWLALAPQELDLEWFVLSSKLREGDQKNKETSRIVRLRRRGLDTRQFDQTAFWNENPVYGKGIEGRRRRNPSTR